MYNPPGATLYALETTVETASGNSADIATKGATAEQVGVTSSAFVGGSSPSVTFKINAKGADGVYYTLYSFTAMTAAGQAVVGNVFGARGSWLVRMRPLCRPQSARARRYAVLADISPKTGRKGQGAERSRPSFEGALIGLRAVPILDAVGLSRMKKAEVKKPCEQEKDNGAVGGYVGKPRPTEGP